MYSCREASRIASEALDRKLTLQERINLRMHLFVCDMCRNFKQNIIALEQTMQRIASGDAILEPLSGQDREIIRIGLEKHLQSTGK